MNLKIKLTTLIGIACLLSAGLQGQSVSLATDPLGIMKISVPDASDTLISVGFHRRVDYEATVQSVNANMITVNGNPSWEIDQFKFQEGVQNERYFLLFGNVDRAGDSEEGKFFEILSNTGSTIEIDLGDETLENLVGDADNGDLVRIIPFWNIASLFSGLASSGIEIRVFSDTEAGPNEPKATVVSYNASSEKWEESNDPGAPIVRDYLNIYPGESVFIRNETGEDKSLIVMGAVPMEAFQTLVYTTENNRPQDIHIGIRSPLPIPLGDSGLGSDGDQLLIFDNELTLKDKAASRIFEYLEDASPKGWYDGVDWMDSTYDLQPGVGYILRRAATPIASSTYWVGKPTYLDILLGQ